MPLLDQSFLFSGSRATSFYRQSVAEMPRSARVSRDFIRACAENKRIESLTELWLFDPCRRALLRHAGVEETFVFGAGSDFEKFSAFATVLQDMTGNNAKLQCHAELRLLFGCELAVCDTHAEEIWQRTARLLLEEGMTYRTLLEKCRIGALLCAAAPTDDLADFAAVKEAHPVFCPDVYFEPESESFMPAVKALCEGEVSFAAFVDALSRALDRFEAHGCHTAVHHVLPTRFCRPDEYHATKIFEKAMQGEALCEEERALYAAQLWRVLGREYVRREMLLELPQEGAFSFQNVEKQRTVGEKILPKAVCELFDYLQGYDGLARAVFYLSAPWQAPVLAAIAARYPAKGEGEPQFSFGIVVSSPAENRERLQALANAVPLSHIVGAFSDQRLSVSLLDGELFCRTVCNLLAEWEEYGELELPQERVTALLRRICHENMRRLYHL
ncbi:MAG: glucuronate isomerase [Ruminococcaceae bacterium]|nr:glucuronate isomerase [Oscillospiraceae bacterium]